jgi:hypothetical protein
MLTIKAGRLSSWAIAAIGIMPAGAVARKAVVGSHLVIFCITILINCDDPNTMIVNIIHGITIEPNCDRVSLEK